MSQLPNARDPKGRTFLLAASIPLAYAVYALASAWRRRRDQRQRIFARVLSEHPAGVACRAALALAAAFVYEGVLMSVSLRNGVEPRMWGLYYYGVFCVIFVVLALAL